MRFYEAYYLQSLVLAFLRLRFPENFSPKGASAGGASFRETQTRTSDSNGDENKQTPHHSKPFGPIDIE